MTPHPVRHTINLPSARAMGREQFLLEVTDRAKVSDGREGVAVDTATLRQARENEDN